MAPIRQGGFWEDEGGCAKCSAQRRAHGGARGAGTRGVQCGEPIPLGHPLPEQGEGRYLWLFCPVGGDTCLNFRAPLTLEKVSENQKFTEFQSQGEKYATRQKGYEFDGVRKLQIVIVIMKRNRNRFDTLSANHGPSTWYR